MTNAEWGMRQSTLTKGERVDQRKRASKYDYAYPITIPPIWYSLRPFRSTSTDTKNPSVSLTDTLWRWARLLSSFPYGDVKDYADWMRTHGNFGRTSDHPPSLTISSFWFRQRCRRSWGTRLGKQKLDRKYVSVSRYVRFSDHTVYTEKSRRYRKNEA